MFIRSGKEEIPIRKKGKQEIGASHNGRKGLDLTSEEFRHRRNSVNVVDPVWKF
jgi:hypothetical protein